MTAPEAPTAPSLSAGAETVSLETFNRLKAELEAKSASEAALLASEAALKAKCESYDTREREKLAELQPAFQDFVKEAMMAHPEYRNEMALTEQYSNNISSAANLESAMSLARTIACFSSGVKRDREKFSAAATATEELSKANAEIDSLKAKKTADEARIAELELLVKERTHAAETMQLKLEQNNLVDQKFDFSQKSAREADTGATSSTSAIAAASPAASSSTFNDPLLTFVSGNNSVVSNKISPSATAHALLGSSGNGEQNLDSILSFL